MPNLITNFTRRIEKYFEEQGIIPSISIPGTNHIDDPKSWEDNNIYKGEVAINLYDGKLYTSDDKDIIQLNSEDFILNGLQVIQPSGAYSGGIPRWLTVTDGFVKIKGRTYKHISSTTKNPSSDGDIQVEPNTSTLNGRYDLIYITGDYPNMHYSTDTNYKAKIGIVKGSENIENLIKNIIAIPEDSILLGIVWVPPSYNDSSIHKLRPWSWSVHKATSAGTFYDVYKLNLLNAQSFPLKPISAAELIYLITMYQFKHEDSIEIKYQRTYLENQILINGIYIYKVNETHYCTSITDSVLSNKMIPIGGISGSPGGGDTGINIHSFLTGLSYDDSGHIGFQRKTFTESRNPTEYDSTNPPVGYNKAEIGNIWINILTEESFICVIDTPGSAKWISAFSNVKEVEEDKKLAALDTSGDNQLATNSTISFTPSNDSYVKIEVNGIDAIVGDGTNVDCDCYFSGDGGISIRQIENIRQGDQIFWMGINAGYDLSSDDEISLFYLIDTSGKSASGDLSGPLWGGTASTP